MRSGSPGASALRPIIWPPSEPESQAIHLNAVPLLVVGAFAALLAAGAVVYLLRRRNRTLTATDAPAPGRREAGAELAGTLVHVVAAEEVGERTVEAAARALRVDFAGLSLVEDDVGTGLVACLDGDDVAVVARGVGSTCATSRRRSRASRSRRAARRLRRRLLARREPPDRRAGRRAERGHRSDRDRVAGDRVSSSSRRRASCGRSRPTTSEVLDELAAEAALALDRTRSAEALGGALERERLVARISRQVRRSATSTRLLDVAVDETGRALGVSRASSDLGQPGEPLPIAAEWNGRGSAARGRPVDARCRRPISPSASGKTVALGDVETAPELDDESLGGRESRCSSSACARCSPPPSSSSSETIGVPSRSHRTEPGAVDGRRGRARRGGRARGGAGAAHGAAARGERAATEAAGRRCSRRPRPSTGELELDTVLQRLRRRGRPALLGGEAADCYLLDARREVLRCAAVHGLPDELVGWEFPADRGVSGAAIETRRRRRGSTTTRACPTRSGTRPMPASRTRSSRRSCGPARCEACSASARGSGRRFDDEARRRARGVRQPRRSGAPQRRGVRGERPPGACRARLLPDRDGARASRSRAARRSTQSRKPRARLSAARSRRCCCRGAEGFEVAGGHGLPPELAAGLGGDDSRPTGPLAHAVESGRIVAVREAATDPRFGEAWRELAWSRRLRVAARDSDRAASRSGRSGSCWCSSPRCGEFSDEDLELARHLAGAAHGALERSELFEEERIARTLAQQLARTGGLLATELDPAAVLDEVVVQAPQLVGADACAIRVVEGEELVVTAAEGDGTTPPLGSRSSATGWLSGDVIQRARAARDSRRRVATSGSPPPIRCCAPATRRSSACRSAGRGRGARRARRLRATAARVARRGDRGVCAPSRAMPRRRSRTPSSTSASRSSGSAASRSSRTSPTGSSPSTATATWCSGTAPPRRSRACRRRRRSATRRCRCSAATSQADGLAPARRPPRLDPPRRRRGLAVGHARRSCATRRAPSPAASTPSATSPPTGSSSR